jgi:hypothetical protein
MGDALDIAKCALIKCEKGKILVTEAVRKCLSTNYESLKSTITLQASSENIETFYLSENFHSQIPSTVH